MSMKKISILCMAWKFKHDIKFESKTIIGGCWSFSARVKSITIHEFWDIFPSCKDTKFDLHCQASCMQNPNIPPT